MDRAMTASWNEVVGQEDKVFHLGDFSFGNMDTKYCSSATTTAAAGGTGGWKPVSMKSVNIRWSIRISSFFHMSLCI
jgi:hypothetical protein